MRVEIRVPNLAGAGALCEYARHRLLSRLGHEVRGIEALTICLTPVRGPGKAAIRCRMLARVSPVVHMAVQETDGSAHAAIDTASERLALALQGVGGSHAPSPIAEAFASGKRPREKRAGSARHAAPFGRGRRRPVGQEHRRGTSGDGPQIR